jgi:hypothetical protein
MKVYFIQVRYVNHLHQVEFYSAGDRIAKEMAVAIRKNKTLAYLNMSNISNYIDSNAIGNKGAGAIMNALKVNIGLIHLMLANN